MSIPVFFDTVFFLLIPLVRSLYAKTRHNYLLYVMAVGAGAVVTHSLVPPTPGPWIMVETRPGLDLVVVIVVGFFLGLVPTLVGGLGYGSPLNRRLRISVDPLQEVVDSPPGQSGPADENLPGFWISILPVVLPVVLFSGRTLLEVFVQAGMFQLSRTAIDLADLPATRTSHCSFPH